MVKTRSEQWLEKQGNLPPLVTDKMVKSVSDYRRSALEAETQAGRFREPGSENRLDGFAGASVLSTASYSSLKKIAQVPSEFSSIPEVAHGAGNSYRGPGGTVRQTPEVYSPLWLNSNLNLPRDRATINAWCRAFFALNPMVHNAISLHSTYPISKMNIKCKDPRVEQFFGDMTDELNIMDICVQIAQEYFTMGEVFPYAEFDAGAGKWSRISLQNPDYIHVKRSVIAGEPIISLRPDENLRRIVFSNRPADIQQRRQLDKSIIEHVRRGENIPLNNFYISQLARKISAYEIRGTSLIVPCFRALMLFDKLRESKFVQADNLINPITLVKIGNENFKPTPADIDLYRQIFEEAQYDKDFKIFTHEAVTIERVGAQGGIIDISGDVTQLIKEIYIGLMVPQVLMDGGADTSYANGGVALDVLRQRYMQFRNMLSNWLKRKIFAPISKINDFYEFTGDGKKKLIVPDVEWNHMSLFDVDSYISAVSTLATGEVKKASLQVLYRSLGLDWEDEQRKIRKEAIDEAIALKEKEVLSKMNLNELKAIKDADEIKETPASPVPGEDASETPPAGGTPGGGGGGIEMPSLPGVGGPPGGGGPPPPPAPPGPPAPPSPP
jgi:hypothetical protein